ncbi:dipeptide/oligopeptide/nickel ABC transporter ATP-binding protein [Borreliella burgdorferi]|uniref:Oligopeptide transport ATP-binding protein OppD n=4 Tax=Borreliella burgdorferi TaxID=139 RepID=H7C7Q3_BORBU|nr:ABC transporter ATP-binding protein [Borreliella burgdorferi]AGS66351.1 oligopeptide transport system ATP-binding protein [Borreliella burgdorferi CA382]EOA80140.1 phosphonate C-P lyase system protein PhnK [Borreliella burgdorferi CA8]AAC46287.1 oligopeptide permease homolog D [Borreliella burgdorferi]AAC66722.1 oligopeptide transport ATP-binding protein OppD [Borreliella burgdorferi B31]ACK75180.1 oligopeptide transport ATP-binding protein OppD [Borreliella burgdorferi ZS7]
MEKENILEIKNLTIEFRLKHTTIHPVSNVNLSVKRGEIRAIVGESGSGKSVTSMAILKLLPELTTVYKSGEILFENQDLLKLSEKELLKIRGNKISMIFQDPMTSLNPFLRISTQLEETIILHQGLGKKEAKEKAIEMLKTVGVVNAEERIKHFPHQFSGGMRQRVMIAMALSCHPSLLIADEPTTALDVTIQEQILLLIKNLSKKFNTSTIFITHDLAVVAEICDTVSVMYQGKIVEEGTVEEIFNNPKHPYTIGLLKSILTLEHDPNKKLYSTKENPMKITKTSTEEF